MLFIYCDEQDNDQEEWSAAACCAFESRSLINFRDYVIDGLREVFVRGSNSATPFPVLHASELPGFLDDENKVKLFHLILSGVEKYACFIYRVGYYWNSPAISFFEHLGARSPQQRARIASYTTLQGDISNIGRPHVFVQELDYGNFSAFSEILNRTRNIEQQTQLRRLTGVESNAFENYFGYYYAPKSDYGLYSADFIAYFLKISTEVRSSRFKDKLGSGLITKT